MDLNTTMLEYLSKNGKIINLSAGNNPENLWLFQDKEIVKNLTNQKLTESTIRKYIYQF